MEKAPVGLMVTSYEKSPDSGKFEPILSHIFWGETLEQATSYATSHLISDVFFAASFVGRLPWKNVVLELGAKGEVLSSKDIINERDLDKALDDLAAKAKGIDDLHQRTGVIRVIQEISAKQKRDDY